MTTVETNLSRHYVAGEWVDAAGGRTFEDLDPFTGEVVAEVAAVRREDAERAIEAAAARTPASSRWGCASRSASSARSRRGTRR